MTTHYAYDIRGRLTGLGSAGTLFAGDDLFVRRQYRVDCDGVAGFRSEGVVHTYGYDGHNRLCQATGCSRTTASPIR